MKEMMKAMHQQALLEKVEVEKVLDKCKIAQPRSNILHQPSASSEDMISFEVGNFSLRYDFALCSIFL